MTRALQITSHVMRVSSTEYPDANNFFSTFKDGRCAITVRSANVFKVRGYLYICQMFTVCFLYVRKSFSSL